MELGIPALLIPYGNTRMYLGDSLGGMPALLVRWIPISCLQLGLSLQAGELETIPCRHPNLPTGLLQWPPIFGDYITGGDKRHVGDNRKLMQTVGTEKMWASAWSWSLPAHLHYMCTGYVGTSHQHKGSCITGILTETSQVSVSNTPLCLWSPKLVMSNAATFFWKLPMHCRGTPSLLP